MKGDLGAIFAVVDVGDERPDRGGQIAGEAGPEIVVECDRVAGKDEILRAVAERNCQRLGTAPRNVDAEIAVDEERAAIDRADTWLQRGETGEDPGG